MFFFAGKDERKGLKAEVAFFFGWFRTFGNFGFWEVSDSQNQPCMSPVSSNGWQCYQRAGRMISKARSSKTEHLELLVIQNDLFGMVK